MRVMVVDARDSLVEAVDDFRGGDPSRESVMAVKPQVSAGDRTVLVRHYVF
jgi:hypothetical protein